ncbi:hypothetical protein PMIN06_002715 [Paraphaeosphaeria minitans]
MTTITAAWLLPIVERIMASAFGALVASVSPNPDHALIAIIRAMSSEELEYPSHSSFSLHRLAVYKLPSITVIVIVFLYLCPMGQGGYAAMQLGKVWMKVFPVLRWPRSH